MRFSVLLAACALATGLVAAPGLNQELPDEFALHLSFLSPGIASSSDGVSFLAPLDFNWRDFWCGVVNRGIPERQSCRNAVCPLDVGVVGCQPAQHFIGTQVSGLNLAYGDAAGLQAAAGPNFVGKDFLGGQIGAGNHIGGAGRGVQAGVFVNTVDGDFSGVQIAGLGSEVKGEFHGVQISGFVSAIFSGGTGGQIALLGCGADKGTWLQIGGLYNELAEQASGLQIGLLNYNGRFWLPLVNCAWR